MQIFSPVILPGDNHTIGIGDNQVALDPVLGIIIGGNGDAIAWLEVAQVASG